MFNFLSDLLTINCLPKNAAVSQQCGLNFLFIFLIYAFVSCVQNIGRLQNGQKMYDSFNSIQTYLIKIVEITALYLYKQVCIISTRIMSFIIYILQSLIIVMY